MKAQKPIKVFVTLVTPYLFGMERSVIQRFELLQPEIKAQFMLTYTVYRLKLPILSEIEKANISYSFLSDKNDWPTPRKPRSFTEAVSILKAILLSNRDTLLASGGKDIFYIPSLRAIYSVFFTILYYRLQRKPVVYGFHDTLDKPSRLLKLLGPLISNYVFHSQFTRNCFEQNNTWSIPRNSPTLPNVVRYMPSSTPSPLPEHSRTILFVGQIAPYKGADLLIEAFCKIKDDYPDVTLHFVGTPHNDYQDTFQTKINLPSNEHRIVHWGYRDDVHEFLKSAHIFVQPSRPSMFAEAFGRGVVEAMAAGVPSICFRCGALPEHVIHEVTGLICDDESSECLAEQLRKLLENTKLQEMYGEQARARYETIYAPDIVKSMWIEYFQGLVQNK